MGSLRLMTYNVRYFGHGTRGVVSTRGGVQRIARAVAELEPLADIICLQEVERFSLRSRLVTGGRDPRGQLDVLMEAIDGELSRLGVAERYHAQYFPAHRYGLTRSTALYTTGLAVLVRPHLRVVAHNAETPEDITHRRGAKRLKQTRICAHLAVEHDAFGRLDVFNTHMSLPGWFYKQFWMGEQRMGFGPNQLAEARRLLEVIEHRRNSDHVVLVGDFNSLPGSPVDQLLQAESNLVDAFATRSGLPAHELERWGTAGFMQARMNIDRIYATPGVEWLDFDGTHTFGDPQGPFSGMSDHAPLVGRLRLG